MRPSVKRKIDLHDLIRKETHPQYTDTQATEQGKEANGTPRPSSTCGIAESRGRVERVENDQGEPDDGKGGG